jgi:hypothetical protein
MNYQLTDDELLILKELIRKIFEGFSENKNVAKVSKKTVQKILYKLNKKLSNDSPIKNAVPFYWFLAGPYSEKVDSAITVMKYEKVLVPDDGIYEMYVFNPHLIHSRFLDHNDSFQEARKIISEEVSQMKGFSNLQMVRDIYDDSPLLFYPTYKSRFLVYFESFCNYYLEQNDNLQNLFSENDILESLGKARLSLPSDPIFKKFNLVYQDFVTIVSKVLNYNRKNDSEFLTVLQTLETLANKIWYVFAYGARILEHDQFYESKVQTWNGMFTDQLLQLEDAIAKTSFLVSEVLQINIVTKQEESKCTEDKVFKKKLAKLLGFDRIPEYDEDAFSRLTGIIQSRIKTKDFDSVGLVREARES